MSHIKAKLQADEDARIDELNAAIDEFSEFTDIDNLPEGYESYEERMFEVTKTTPEASTLMDFLEDIEFPNVEFPEKIKPLIRERDVFLATIGLQNSSWSVLFLSPLYEEEVFEFSDEAYH